MQFSCTRENLHLGLSVVGHVPTKNVNLPILGHVLIKTDGKIAELSTTNLEIALRAEVRGKIDAPGEFTVPAKLLADYVGLLPGERVDLAVDGATLAVSSGKYHTKIKGMPASEFPLIPNIQGGAEYLVPARDLRRAISRVVFAASPNESRPEIAGIFMDFAPGKAGDGALTLAATDSYRLAEAKVVLHSGAATAARSGIVPTRTMAELLRVVALFRESGGEAEENIKITFSENQISFSWSTVQMVSRTIEGRYPEYRAIIPETSKSVFKVAREEIIKAVKATALFSRSGLYDVKLALTPPGALELRAADAQTGEQTASLDAAVSGAENFVTLNYRYLLDGLQALETEEAEFRMTDAGSPCLLLPSGKGALPDYRYIVMPIKQ